MLWSAEGAGVDGKPWPMLGSGMLRLPPGSHTAEPAAKRDAIDVKDLNATLKTAAAEGRKVTFTYQSESRALVSFDRRPATLEIDGAPGSTACLEGSTCTILLPAGEHRVAAQ